MSDSEVSVWNGFAPIYDTVIRPFRPRYSALLAELRWDLAGASRVLEIAAGTGAVTLGLATLVPALVATDISPRMLGILRNKLASAPIKNVDVLEQSVYALAFADGEFDAVVCVNGLHVMQEPDRALDEMCRVLRPGGLVLIATFCHGQDARARTISRLMSLSSRFRAHTRFSRAALGRRLEQHGLELRRVRDLGGVVPLVYVVGRKPDRGSDESGDH